MAVTLNMTASEFVDLVTRAADASLGEEGRREAEAGREKGWAAFSVWEDYDPSKTYQPLNKVLYEGSTYVCLRASTGKAPSGDNADWLLVAAKGEQGARGEPGPSYTLPVASPEALGGVRPVAKTAEMTQAVGVDADGMLWALPGGGAGPVLKVATSPATAGLEVAAMQGAKRITGITDENGQVALQVDSLGDWTVSAVVEADTFTSDVSIPEEYLADLVLEEKEEFELLEYATTGIRCSIDTGIKPTYLSSKIILDITVLSFYSSSIDSYIFLVPGWMGLFTKGGTSYSFWAGSPSKADTFSKNITNLRTTIEFNGNDRKLKIGGSSYSILSGVTNTTVHSNTLRLFTATNCPRIRFYSAKVFVKDELIGDFYAAKNSAGEVGLYNKVNGLFCKNEDNYSFPMEPGPTIQP